MHKIHQTILFFILGFVVGMIVAVYNLKTMSAAVRDVLGDISLLKVEKRNKAIIQLQTKTSSIRCDLYESVQILCWVMTTLEHTDRQTAIVETWGKRCHRLLFVMADKIEHLENVTADGRIQNLFLPLNETYNELWAKTKAAFLYVYKTFTKNSQTYDFVLKIDDDSYCIMENLQLFLSTKSQTDPHYYGAAFRVFGGYNSGGPGYVMSWTNLGKLVNNISAGKCDRSNTGSEDVNIGACFAESNITAGNTTDNAGRWRFSAVHISELIRNQSTNPTWVSGYSAYKLNKGLDCCSDTFISFHYVTPDMMRTIEFLVYYSHPFSTRKIWNAILH